MSDLKKIPNNSTSTVGNVHAVRIFLEIYAVGMSKNVYTYMYIHLKHISINIHL